MESSLEPNLEPEVQQRQQTAEFTQVNLVQTELANLQQVEAVLRAEAQLPQENEHLCQNQASDRTQAATLAIKQGLVRLE